MAARRPRIHCINRRQQIGGGRPIWLSFPTDCSDRRRLPINFEMEKDDKVGNDVCTKLIQKGGVRQQHYRPKKIYFNGYTAQEALSSNHRTLLMRIGLDLSINGLMKETRKYKKYKYNNQDPSPIEFFKDTHTNSKTRSMSKPALLAHNAMEKKRETIRSMGYASRYGRSRSTTSSAQIRVLEERIEQKDREARAANDRHREELAAKLEAQERAFEEIQKKQQEELEALKKSQQEKNEAWAKKQKEMDNLLDFLMRTQES